jgi:DNA-binding CsgD family transcriptional regulator
MKPLMRILISIFAIIFLFGIHSKLLWILNPDKINKPVAIIDNQTGQSHIEYHAETFSFIRFQDENNSSAMVAAIIFSIITVFILNLFDPKDWFFWVAFPIFAITDGIGTILYLFPDIDKLQLFSFILADGKLNNIPNTKLIGAFYYGIYVIIFLASIAMLRIKFQNKKKDISIDEIYSNAKREFGTTLEFLSKGNIPKKRDGEKPIVRFIETDESNQIAELKNQGLKQKEIAEKLKISQSKVSKTLKKLVNSEKNN